MLYVAPTRVFEHDDAHHLARMLEQNRIACALLLAGLYQHHPDHAVAALRHIEPNVVDDLVPPAPPQRVVVIELGSPQTVPVINLPKRASIDLIQRAACEYFKVEMPDLLSDRRSKEIVRPRQVAVYVCRKLTLQSLPQIGRRFGNRDHTTIMAACKKIETLRKTEPAIDQAVVTLSAKFVAAH